jgi:YegS/Rv2252/BmrU family lipid kinase
LSRKITLIANLASNNFRDQNQFDQYVFDQLTKNGFEVSLCQTTSLAELEKAVADSLNLGIKEFVSIGGDGSLHHLVNQLFAQSEDITRIKLAVLPKGTGNDYIRNFNFNSKREIVDALIKENFRPIDVGVLYYENETKHFINMLGIGFSAAVVEKLGRYKWLGGLSYYIALIDTFFNYKSEKITFEIDGQIFNTDCFQLSVGLGKFAGSNMKLCPSAIVDDGLLDINIIEKVSFWKLIRYIHTLKDGSYLKHIPSKSFQTKSIKLKDSKGIKCEADGEEISVPTAINIIEKAIKFICN